MMTVKIPPQGLIPSDLFAPARAHFSKFPETSKVAPPAGAKHSTQDPVGHVDPLSEPNTVLMHKSKAYETRPALRGHHMRKRLMRLAIQTRTF